MTMFMTVFGMEQKRVKTIRSKRRVSKTWQKGKRVREEEPAPLGREKKQSTILLGKTRRAIKIYKQGKAGVEKKN